MPLDPDVAALVTTPSEDFEARSRRRGRQLVRRRRMATATPVALVLVAALAVPTLVGGGHGNRLLRTTPGPAAPPPSPGQSSGGPEGLGGPGAQGGGLVPSGQVFGPAANSERSPSRRPGGNYGGDNAGSARRLPQGMGKIAFARVLQNSSDIYAMNANGSGLTNLTHDDPTGGGWQAYDPAWSPDGRRIAFTGAYNAGRTQDPLGTTEYAVFVMNADGSGRRRVTPPKPSDGHGYSHPAWLADSRHLLLEGDDSASDSDLYLADVDGLSLRDLTNTRSVREVDPQPSADGSRIVFSAIRSGSYSIWTMNIDGTGRHQLLSCGAAPSWSPDGHLLVFVSADCVSSRESHVWIARADGSGAHGITTEKNPGWTGSNPAWTSDGHLLFVRDPDGPMNAVAPDVGVPSTGGGPQPGFIVSANADGSGERQVTNPVPGQDDAHPTAWSM